MLLIDLNLQLQCRHVLEKRKDVDFGRMVRKHGRIKEN